MSNLMIEAVSGDAIPRPAAVEVDPRHMTAGQLRTLGLTHVAYVTESILDGDPVAYTIRGADGLVVAVFQELDSAVEHVGRLGLALVPVH
jgi:hypothetical protein